MQQPPVLWRGWVSPALGFWSFIPPFFNRVMCIFKLWLKGLSPATGSGALLLRSACSSRVVSAQL